MRKTSWAIAAIAACATGGPLKASTQQNSGATGGRDGSISEPTSFEHLAQQLGGYGLTRTWCKVQQATLKPGASASYRITYDEGDSPIAVAAHCSSHSDVDVEVRDDTGRVVAKDVAADWYPVVAIAHPKKTTYEITLINSSDRVASVEWNVFLRPTVLRVDSIEQLKQIAAQAGLTNQIGQSSGTVPANLSTTFTVDIVEDGGGIAVLAFSEGGGDIDLQLFNSAGTLVAEDKLEDNCPLVTATVAPRGRYQARVVSAIDTSAQIHLLAYSIPPKGLLNTRDAGTNHVSNGELREAQEIKTASEQAARFRDFIGVVGTYGTALERVIGEAADAIKTCLDSPPNRVSGGSGPPPHLEAKRARERFNKELSTFEGSAAAVTRVSASGLPVDRRDAVTGVQRAVESDLEGLRQIATYLKARGDDKYDEFEKAARIWESLNSGTRYRSRLAALRQLD